MDFVLRCVTHPLCFRHLVHEVTSPQAFEGLYAVYSTVCFLHADHVLAVTLDVVFDEQIARWPLSIIISRMSNLFMTCRV